MESSPLRWKSPFGAETDEIGDGDNEKGKIKEGNWTQQRARLFGLLAVTEALTGMVLTRCEGRDELPVQQLVQIDKDAQEGGTGGQLCLSLCLAVVGGVPVSGGCAWARSLALCLAASTSTGLPSTVHFHFPLDQVGSRDWRSAF